MAELTKNHNGKQVGSYRIIDRLGNGGFADAYLGAGEHIYLKTQSTIKMLLVQLSEHALHNFLNEAQIIAHLEHPTIIADCIQASTSNMNSTSLLGTGNPGPRSLNLTTCGEIGSKNWQASVQSSRWLSLSLYSGSLASKASIARIRVQASSGSLAANIYHGSIIFTAETS